MSRDSQLYFILEISLVCALFVWGCEQAPPKDLAAIAPPGVNAGTQVGAMTGGPQEDAGLAMAGMNAGAHAGGDDAGDIAGEDLAGAERAGALGGADAGESAGERAGEAAGESAGESAGEAAGERSGSEAGATAGAEAGAFAGAEAGAFAGAEAGALAGAEAGALAGDEAGMPAGGEAGELAGEEAGEMLPDEPIEGCTGPYVTSGHTQASAATQQPECVTCVGASPPDFMIRDLNPASCGVGQYYGLNAFQGEVTLVVLLRATCGYCQAQLLKLEEMRFELLVLGHIVRLVVINEANTEDFVSYLTDRTTSAVLQDTTEVGAWRAMGDLVSEMDDTGVIVQRQIGGDKDDFYIYGTDGTLSRFLDDDNREFSLNLNTEEGYTNLYDALLEVLTE